MGDKLGLSRKWHVDWIQEAQAIADEEPVEISQPVKNMTAVFDLVETARLGSAHNMRMPVNATTPIPTDPRGQFKREVQLRTIELAAQTLQAQERSFFGPDGTRNSIEDAAHFLARILRSSTEDIKREKTVVIPSMQAQLPGLSYRDTIAGRALIAFCDTIIAQRKSTDDKVTPVPDGADDRSLAQMPLSADKKATHSAQQKTEVIAQFTDIAKITSHLKLTSLIVATQAMLYPDKHAMVSTTVHKQYLEFKLRFLKEAFSRLPRVSPILHCCMSLVSQVVPPTAATTETLEQLQARLISDETILDTCHAARASSDVGVTLRVFVRDIMLMHGTADEELTKQLNATGGNRQGHVIKFIPPTDNIASGFGVEITTTMHPVYNHNNYYHDVMRTAVNATTPTPTDPRGQFKREVQLRTIELAAQTRY